MATTRTPGITVLADGRRFIDKRYLGVRIGLRVGAVTQEQAEERLRTEVARVESNLARKAHARPTFTNCAARYVEQSRAKRSIDVIKWHVALLQRYIGDLEPQQIHDQTLEPFIKARLAAGESTTTINRSLEVVRTVVRGSRECRRLSRCCPRTLARPTRSRGRSKTRSSAGSLLTSPAWRSLRSTRGSVKATYAACNGSGRSRCPRSVEACS